MVLQLRGDSFKELGGTLAAKFAQDRKVKTQVCAVNDFEANPIDNIQKSGPGHAIDVTQCVDRLPVYRARQRRNDPAIQEPGRQLDG